MINKALFARCRIDEIPKVIPGQKSASGKRFRLTFQQSGLPSGIAKAACSHTSYVARDVEMSARDGG